MAFRSRAAVENAPYFALYIITRVNRRIYAYIEIIEPGGTADPEQIAAIEEPQVEEAAVSSAASSNILQQLREQGSVILSGIDFQSNDRLPTPLDVASLVAALQADASVSVYLVAHLSQEGRSLEELMERSAARANSLRQALIAGGISADRIEAAGVGPLAPSCAVDNCAQRIELVLR
jgi:outer membrane protein OmpA-like peptidoglycan-associated protein